MSPVHAVSVGRPAWRSPWVIAALLGGFGVGWIDRTATAVQGPLLLLMTVAFVASIPRRAPAWTIAVATFAGLPVAHIVGHALGDQGTASWGMAIVLVPTAGAAYVGAAIGIALRSADALIERRILIGASLLATSVVGTAPVYATLVARGQPFAWWVTAIWQLITLVAWAVASPFLIRAWQNQEASPSADTPNAIIRHASVILGIAIGHSALLPLATRMLFIPLGAASVPRAIAWALAAYLPLDLLAYVAVAGAAYASDADRRAREATLREGAARGELAVATLASLRAQLRPHFLFNALNTASVLASRGDADGTRRVLAGLGDLLRYVMRGSDRPNATPDGMVSLKEEIAFVQQYLSLERERFPERLRTTIDVTPDAEAAMIPSLLLQPLVENAIIHGIGGRIGAGEVVVRAGRNGSILRLAVEDDGPGPGPKPNATTGIGLTNTRARLAVLYGSNATLTVEQRAGGGTVAAISLPLSGPA